jgi:hypothetical protein
MDAPQSDDEVRPVVAALQRIDPRLDVLWNPRCVLTRTGGYDAEGRLVAPTYEGRWQVILHDRAIQTATWRDHVLVCTVTPPAADAPAGVPALTHNGPYAPLGEWLVEHLRAIDQANAASMAKISAAIDADLARQDRARDTATAEAAGEACRRQFHAGAAEQGVATSHPVRIDLRGTPSLLTPR